MVFYTESEAAQGREKEKGPLAFCPVAICPKQVHPQRPCARFPDFRICSALQPRSFAPALAEYVRVVCNSHLP